MKFIGLAILIGACVSNNENILNYGAKKFFYSNKIMSCQTFQIFKYRILTTL